MTSEEDRALFLNAVEGTTPLKRNLRAETGRKPPQKRRVPDSGEMPRNFLSDHAAFPEEASSFCRPGLSRSLSKLKKGRLAAGAQLDLHGMTSDEAGSALLLFLEQARSRAIRVVRIVHGKGYGSKGRPVLKSRVRNWLVQIPEVLAFAEACPQEGGSGALLVLLRASGEGTQY